MRLNCHKVTNRVLKFAHMVFSSVLSRAARLSTVMASKFNVVFVLGAPGSGKGTQCDKIVKEFGYVHLSAGDLLRAEQASEGSQYGSLIDGHIRAGTIVPVEITCSLLQRAMEESGKENFLIDGFPRNENNLAGWNATMSDAVSVKFVLFFDCPLDVCSKRCLARGAAGSGRADDNEESLKKRFNTFMEQTMPIVNHYEAKGLVRKVGATREPEEVFAEVKGLFA